MKRISIVLLVMVFCSMFSFADAAIVAKGKPLSQVAVSDKKDADDDKATVSDKKDADDDKATVSDKKDADDDKATVSDKKDATDDKVSPTFLAGARKTSKESEFHAVGFDISLTKEFIIQMMDEEGNDRHTDIYLFTSSEEMINNFMREGRKMGLEMRLKKSLKEKDVPKKLLEDLTSPWDEDDSIVGVQIQIVDKSKESAIMKLRRNPLFGLVGGLVPGASAALSLVELGSTYVK